MDKASLSIGQNRFAPKTYMMHAAKPRKIKVTNNDGKRPNTILASLNRHSENVFIKAVIIAKLKFSDIEREVFCTDLVERTDDTALEGIPEAFNRLSMHRNG